MSTSNKVVLVTGATGFLGSHLVERLVTEGHRVVIVIRKSSNLWRLSPVLDKVKIHNLDGEVLETLFSENHVETVFHLATKYLKYNGTDDIQEMILSNVAFPCQILELAKIYGTRYFINTGTFFELDCSLNPVSETASTKPFNFYATTKIDFENHLVQFSGSVFTSTVRLFSPYGRRDNQKIIPTIVQNALGNKITKLSFGTQKLDFIFDEDIVEAYFKVWNFLQENKPGGHETFNIGSGEAHSIREVVSLLEEIERRKILIQWGEPSFLDIQYACSDISKAKKILKWEPRTNIKNGLKKVLDYYRIFNDN